MTGTVQRSASKTDYLSFVLDKSVGWTQISQFSKYTNVKISSFSLCFSSDSVFSIAWRN